MPNVIPLRYQYSGTDTVGFSELRADETIDFSYIDIVSGTDIKTINNTSILGSGNVSVQETLVSGTNIKTINNQSLLGSGNLTIEGGTGTGESFHPFLLCGA